MHKSALPAMMTFPVMWTTKVMQRSDLHRSCCECTSPWALHSIHRLRLIHKQQFLAVPVLLTQCEAEFNLGLEALSKLCTIVSCLVAFKKQSFYHPRIPTSSERELEVHAANVCSDLEILLKTSY